MPFHRTAISAAVSRTFRRALPWALALAVATCTDDSGGPSSGGRGYFAFKPVYGISGTLSQFGIVADSVHIRLTRPVDEVVLDTTVFFPADSSALHLALPVVLEQSPESLSAVIEISAQGVVIFVDSLDIEVEDGPPSAGGVPTVDLEYVGPGSSIATITIAPSDTTIVLGDTLFFTATAQDSSALPVASFYVGWTTSDTTFAKINGQGRLIAPNARGTVKVIGFTPTGIADTMTVTFAPAPTQILTDSGNAQTGAANDSLTSLFVARVLAADNLPIAGIGVRFVAASGAGSSVRDTMVLFTDAQGRVRTRGKLGLSAAVYSYSAQVVGTAILNTFTATATANTPTGIAVQGGNLQTDSAGRALPVALQVRVTDAFTNPVSGAKIYWTRPVGTGVRSADSTFTNGAGIASITYTLGAVGIDSIKASLAGTSAFVDFRATAINGAVATVVKTFGNAQSDTVGQLATDSLIVQVRSLTTQPVVGQAVVWTVLRGGSTSDDTVFTDVNGLAAVRYTLGTVTGIDSVRAQAGSVSTIFTATAGVGAPTAVTLISGDAQTDTIGRTLSQPLVVRVRDAFNNPVAGVFVHWATAAGSGAAASDSTISNGTGLASVGYTLGALAGTDSITATLGCACSGVTFTATAIQAAPASVITIFGAGQTVTVNTEAPDTITVLVRDALNNPVSGVNVDWSVIPAVGSLTILGPTGIQRNVSDASGVARIVFTAGTVAGNVRIEAQVGSIIDSVFVTQVAAAPSAISIQSGDAQSDTVGNAIPLSMVAHVADAFGNPVSGAMVLFNRTAGTGTLFADSVATDSSGNAAVGYLFGHTPGVDTIRATLSGTAAFVDFQATALAATPAFFTAQSGDGQNAQVTAVFTDSVEVAVLDGAGDPIVNAAVVWTADPGLSLSDDTTFTDLNGRSWVHVTAGTAAGVFDVTAAAVGTPFSATFTLTVLPGAAASIALNGGNAQVDTIGRTLATPFSVQVHDLYGNTVPGASVIFVRTVGTGTVVPDTAVAGATGLASAGYTLGDVVATDTIVATLDGTGSTVTFTAQAILPLVGSVVEVAGNGSVDTAGQTFPSALVAEVRDGAGAPIPGAQAVWSITSGNGSLDVDTVLTGVDGRTSATYTAGTLAGDATIEVRALPSNLTFTFTVTKLADAASALTYVSGTAQNDTTSAALAAPFVTRVFDQYGNAVAGANVIFTRTVGTGALAQDTVASDATGFASTGYTLGGTAGTDTIIATLEGTASSVTFSATAINGAVASIVDIAGNGSTDTVGMTFANPLVAEVRDGNGSPIAGALVIWSVTAGGGSLDVDTVAADSLGRSSALYTAGTLAADATIDVVAVYNGVKFTFTVYKVADVPALITISSGHNQTDTVDTDLPNPLVAHVTDQYGNDVSGATVAYSVLAGGGLVSSDTAYSDASGLVTVGYTLGSVAGTNNIKAALVGSAESLNFIAHAVYPAVASVVDFTGDGSTDTVGTMLDGPLTVTVLGAGAQPIPGSLVAWKVLSGGGTVGPDTTVTDASGRTSTAFYLGGTAGPALIEARAVGTAFTDTFTVTQLADAPSAIVIVSGNDQLDSTLKTLQMPFVAGVTDAYGNPIANAAVVYQVIAGGGSMGNDTVFTDSLGYASSYYTLGETIGTDTVRVTLVGTSAFVDFSASTFSSAPASLAKLLGDGQSDTVRSTLADSLVVQLLDNGGNPVSGNWIHWITAGATLSSDSTLTDGTGRAAVQMTFDSIAAQLSVAAFIGDTTVGTAFIVHATAGTATQISAITGLGQTGQISAALPIDFGVLLQDAYGNLAGAGVPVVWSNIAGFAAAGLPDTTLTDSTSIAYLVGPMLGAVTGEDSLQAQIPGQPATALFTATATTGAAGSLVYVSGTGQADTVGQTLPTDFVVQVVDAGSNPISGVWVQWAIVSGNGSLSVDSSQTDGSGAASVSLTLRTALGVDSVVASVPGVGNTVTFYSQTVADAPADLALLDGNGQAALPDSALLLPFRVQVTDQYGNPIEALQVDFAVGADELTFTTPSPTTDAAGVATTGTVFVGPNSGAFTATATTAALPGDTVLFSVTGVPQGVTKTWTGAVNADFADGNNWAPAGAPGAFDNAFIPVSASNIPVLDVSRTLGGLIIENGTGLYLNDNILTVNWNLVVDGQLARTTGHTVMAGNGFQARGHLGALEVTGTISLSGDADVGPGLQVTDGAFSVNGHTLLVNGDLDVSGNAEFRMVTDLDTVRVNGNASFNGSTATGQLTAGVLSLNQDLSVGATGAFRASGTHLTLFYGEATQNLDLGSPAAQFQDLRIQNNVVMASNIMVAGDAVVSGGTLTGPFTALVGGGITDPTNVSWAPTNTFLTGTTSTLPDSFAHSLQVAGGNVSLAKSLVVHGQFTVNGGSFSVNGFTLRVDSLFTTMSGGEFRMESSSDSVDIAGSATWDGSASTGLLTAGVLVLRSDFTVPNASRFRASGSHRTLFAGGSTQIVDVGLPALGANQFQEVEFATEISGLSGIAVAGDTKVLALVGLNNAVLGGDLDITGSDSNWNVGSTVFAGNPTVLPDTILGALEFQGDVTLQQPTWAMSNLDVTSGRLTVGGQPLTVGGDLTVSGTAEFTMQNSADSVDVTGTATWSGTSTTDGMLNDGLLLLRGNLDVPTSTGVFRGSGSHRTVFAGSTTQSITFAGASLATNRLNTLELRNSAGIILTGNLAVAAAVVIDAGSIEGEGFATVAGGIFDSTGASWTPQYTILTGSGEAFPDAFARNVEVQGNLTLNHPLTVHGSLWISGTGVLDLSGRHLRVDGAFQTSTSAQLKMQDGADTLDVGGTADINGSTASGLLTAGTAIFRGYFIVGATGNTYRASGTHTTVFADSGVQTATMFSAALGGNQFQNLRFENGDTLDFNTSAVAAGTVTVNGGIVTGGTLVVMDTFTVAVDTNWQMGNTWLAGAFTWLPDTFVNSVQVTGAVTLAHNTYIGRDLQVTNNGVLNLNGHHLRVDSTVAVTSGSSQLNMNGAADTLDIGGVSIWSGDADDTHLTAGVLILHNSLSTGSGGEFKPTGTHKTVIADSATVSLSWNSPSFGGAGFQELEIRPGATVNANADVFVRGTVTKVAGAAADLVAGAGGQTLHARALAFDGVNSDGVTFDLRGATPTTFNNVSFSNIPDDASAIYIVAGGTPGPSNWSNVAFNFTPSSGKYVAVTDSAADGSHIVINMYASTPLDGTTFEMEDASFGDGVDINWSSILFQTGPVNTDAFDTLPAVVVEIRDPSGAVYTGFNDSVTVSFGTSVGGSTLSGTLTVQADSGLATFSDLAVDVVGAYTLVAQAAGLASVETASFNILIPVPAGFDAVWTGDNGTNWFDGGNWSTGVIPGDTTNVYIPATTNTLSLGADTARTNRLRIASGAYIAMSGGALVVDSSLEAGGSGIVGYGWINPNGEGDLTGTVQPAMQIDGDWDIAGNFTLGGVNITSGSVTVAAGDTLVANNVLRTLGDAVLNVTDASAQVVSYGNTEFQGGHGTMSAGTLQALGPNFSTSGEHSDAFAPDADFLTVLGGGPQLDVYFNVSDTLSGSHFGSLQVSTAGTVFTYTPIAITGNLTITSGATLSDSQQVGVMVSGLTTVETGGTMGVDRLAMAGNLDVQAGASYTVPLTVYFGTAGGVTVAPAPYDTLQISRSITAGAGLTIAGDLRVIDGWGAPARFDIDTATVTVYGSVRIDADGAIVMQESEGVLDVAGDFFTNGASSVGLLTAGTLQIGGNFRQAADGDGAAFWAESGHTTRFTGGSGFRSIQFDSPAHGLSDSTSSKFGTLELVNGVDTLDYNGFQAGRITLGSTTVIKPEEGNGRIEATDSLILGASSTLDLTTLDLWNGVARDNSATFAVETVRFFGGTELPVMPYNGVLISGPDLVMAGDISMNSLTVGQNAEVDGTAGDLDVNGHTLTVGSLNINGLGTLTMTTGDSVDVSGNATFNGGNTAGHLTGGTLVLRASFSAGNHSGDSVFVADSAHRTVFAAGGPSTLYLQAASDSGVRFGKLTVLDAEVRTLTAYGNSFSVVDTLIIGSASAGLSGANGRIVARDVFTVSGSTLSIAELEVRKALAVSGSYAVGNTIFNGTGQLIPDLAYTNVAVWGTASLTAPLTLTGGHTLAVGTDSSMTSSLDLAGFKLAVDDLYISGTGTVPMMDAADTVQVNLTAVFNGGNTSGLMTAGTFISRGNFQQYNTFSDSSFFASGTHTTVFSDTNYSVSASVATMWGGPSRFNHVVVDGRGVNFFGIVYVGGDFAVASPTVDSVGGRWVSLIGSLADPYYRWAVDSLGIEGADPTLPDSLNGEIYYYVADTLETGLAIGGNLHLEAPLFVNNHTVRVHGSMDLAYGGILGMNSSSDDVTIDGDATFGGAASDGFMTWGTLHLKGNFIRPAGADSAFMPSNFHQTRFEGSSAQTIEFDGGVGASRFQDLRVENAYQIVFGTSALIAGTLTDAVEGASSWVGTDSTVVTAGTLDLDGASVLNIRFVVGQTSSVDDVTLSFTDPEGKDQLTVVGEGIEGDIDFHNIHFDTLPGTGHLLAVIDTLENSSYLSVRMFGTTPFDGSSLTTVTGEASAAWSHLTLSGALPLTVDSLQAFDLTVYVTEPGGQPRADVNANVSIALAANPFGATLNGSTTTAFDGSSATFNDLTLNTPGAGVSFFISVDGSTVDTFTTGTLDVINLMPAGAVAWDGEAFDGLWSTASNWSTNAVPTLTDSVFIPGWANVAFDRGGDSIGALVLGTGASLSFLPANDLWVFGRVAASNTISGSGQLHLGGANETITGTINVPVFITGSMTAVGNVVFGSDLIIDGTGAEFNVGGAHVGVTGNVLVQNDGVLTMDGAADTLIATNYTFQGGSEIGRLSAGTMIVNGGGLVQGGASPSAFQASGTHTTVFVDGGATSNVNLANPDSSRFASMVVATPYGVNIEGDYGQAYAETVTVLGNAVLTGDSLRVPTGFSMTSSSTVSLDRLVLGTAPTLDGTYSVPFTWYYGSSYAIPAAPQGYQHLYLDNDVQLGEPVTAQRLTITGTGSLDVNNYNLTVDTLITTASGLLVMNSATDSVFVNAQATILGGDESGSLTAGVLTINGDMNIQTGKMKATSGHKTRFTGTGNQFVIVSPICEGPCFTPVPTFSHVEVAGDSVFFSDPGNHGVSINGTFHVMSGQFLANGGNQNVTAGGNVIIDTTGGVTIRQITLYGGLDFRGTDSTQFRVQTAWFDGSDQTISQAPYNSLYVSGDATLDTAVTAQVVQVLNNGVLTLGGRRLDVGQNFSVTDDANLIMQDAADTLWVGGTATFKGDSAQGDLTAGVIRAKSLRDQVGPSGSLLAFAQTGTGKVVMLGLDSLRLNTDGPAGPRIRMLDLTLATDTVFFGDVWISDSLLATDAATAGYTMDESSSSLVVMGTAIWNDGSLEIGELAVGGVLDIGASATYNVDLTKFVGDSIYIPNNVTYSNIEVQYRAYLAGNLDLTENGGEVTVANIGNLDLNGHTLTTPQFKTDDYGRFTMKSDADTLVSEFTWLAGDSTNSYLTAGTIITAYLYQEVGGSGSTKAYAPSGSHRLSLDDLNTESSVGIGLSTPDADTGSYINILQVTDYTMALATNAKVVVMDSLIVGVDVTSYPGAAIHAHGPAIIGLGSSITFALDTLVVYDTLIVDPQAAYQVNNTVFAAGAAAIPFSNGYLGMIIEGGQSAQGPIQIGASLTIRKGASLDLNGQHVTIDDDLYLVDSSVIVMDSIADTLSVSNAVFAGGASTLSAGVLRIGTGLFKPSYATSDSAFLATGMVTEFVGASTTVLFDGEDDNQLGDVRVLTGTTLTLTSSVTIAGETTVEGSAVLNLGDDNADYTTFLGKVHVDALATLSSSHLGTHTFHDSLLVDPTAAYGVLNTAYQNTNGIAYNVTYTYLYLQDGVTDTLDATLSVISTLSVYASAQGLQNLDLGGQTVQAGSFYAQGYGLITMDSTADALETNGNAIFDGGDQSGLLTAGQIRVGAAFIQDDGQSSKSFRSDGTLLVLDDENSHSITFASPGTGNSYLGGLTLDGGAVLNPQSGLTVAGTVTILNGTFDASGLDGSSPQDFRGTVNLSADATLSHTGPGSLNFYDTLTVDPSATYNVTWTSFSEIDTIPNLAYANLALKDGTVISLAEDLTVTGILAIFATESGDQDLDLNGHTVFAGGTVQTEGHGVISMHSSADTLRMNGNMQFWGGDEAGRLTAGVIDIGSDFSQEASYSDKSFRSSGTTVRFTQNGLQTVSFATPDSSWFAAVSDTGSSTLALVFNTDAQVKGYLSATSVNLIGLPGVTLRADSIRSTGGNLTSAVPRIVTTKVTSYGGLIWNTPYTEYIYPVLISPLSYDTLVVSGGGGYISSNVTAQTVLVNNGTLEIQNGYELHATGDVSVDGEFAWLEIAAGGTLTVDGTFYTFNGGHLISHSNTSGMSAGNVSFQGGDQTALLTAGGMDITGDFYASDATFYADSLYIVNFTGGGLHALVVGGSGTATLGELSIGTEGYHQDTLDLSAISSLFVNTYKFSASGRPLILGNGSLTGLQAERFNVDGADFDRTYVYLVTSSQQPEQFDNVEFMNFTGSEPQLYVNHPGLPGNGLFGDFFFSNVDFDDDAFGNFGFFGMDDADASGANPDDLDLWIGSPDYTWTVDWDTIGSGTMTWIAGGA